MVRNDGIFLSSSCYLKVIIDRLVLCNNVILRLSVWTWRVLSKTALETNEEWLMLCHSFRADISSDISSKWLYLIFGIYKSISIFVTANNTCTSIFWNHSQRSFWCDTRMEWAFEDPLGKSHFSFYQLFIFLDCFIENCSFYYDADL